MGNLSQGEIGSFRTGVAIANPSDSSVSVRFELASMSGTSAGLTGVTTVPARGHSSMFLDQIPGFQSLRVPFRGLLRISTPSGTGVAIAGLRGRYNERSDFLITTTTFSDENAAAAAADVFPHIVFGGGYTTTLVLFSGLANLTSIGFLSGFSQLGQVLVLPGSQLASAFAQAGPWNSDLELYQSEDGLRFTKVGLLAERGGVPVMTRAPDGRIFTLFQWFPMDRPESFDKIAIVISSDDGNTWSVPRTINITGMPNTISRSFDPTLVALPDARFRLYFASDRVGPGQQRSTGTRAIFSAISTDGLNFTFEQGQRFGFDTAETYDPAVALLNGVWHLYCPGIVEGRGYHATSPDGLNFTRQNDVSLPTPVNWLGNVTNFGSGLRFYGTGPTGWVGFSSDGFNWRLEQSVNSPSPDPGIVITASGRTLGVANSARRSDAIARPPFQP
jgi:hypothetical protein